MRRNTFKDNIVELGVRLSLFKLGDNTMIYCDTLLSHRTRLLYRDNPLVAGKSVAQVGAVLGQHRHKRLLSGSGG